MSDSGNIMDRAGESNLINGVKVQDIDYLINYEYLANKPNLDNKADKSDIVQSDWNVSDTSSNAFIKNKPNLTGIEEKMDVLESSMLRKEEMTRDKFNALTERDPSVIYVITDEDDPDFIDEGQKGVANGVATLGSDGKVPTSQLPAMGGHYVGTSAPSNTNLLWINSSNNTINYYTGSSWKAIGAVFG